MAGTPQEERATDNRHVGNRLGGPARPLPIPLSAIDLLPLTKAEKPKWPAPASAPPDYIDRVAESVAIDGDAYVVYWSQGRQRYFTRIEERWILRKRDSTTAFPDPRVRRSRQEAIEGLTPFILNSGVKAQSYVGYYRLSDTAITLPTVFSDVSTPRVMAAIEAKDEDMRLAARAAEDEMKALGKGMLVGKALGVASSAANNPGSALYSKAVNPISDRLLSSSRRPTEGFQGFPFSTARAMNKAVGADKQIPFKVQPPSKPTGFQKPYSEMKAAEQQAFQHAYNQLSSRMPNRLPKWSKAKAEENRLIFNAVVNLIRGTATEVTVNYRNIAVKGSGLPAERKLVAIYESEINHARYYVYCDQDGRFVSAGQSTYSESEGTKSGSKP
jgi:hypothetical protein